MSGSQEPSDHAMPPSSPEVVIGSYSTARQAHEAGLAVLAAGHPYRVELVEGRYALLVDRPHAAALQREINLSERFNRLWPPPSLDLPANAASKVPTAAVIGLLSFMHWAAYQYPSLRDVGKNNAAAALDNGELWRLVTAISLHADLGHLAGNFLGLALFTYLACRYLGNGLAWLLVLLTATLSNLTSVLVQADSEYTSLGASTAVFASLGVITGFPLGCSLRTRQPITTRDWLIPFFGGCVFFAWMGGGDFPTDVGAHLWSFLYGVGFAVAAGRAAVHGRVSARGQRFLLAASATIFIGAWAWGLWSIS